MRLTGNILQIKNKPDPRNKAIEIQIDAIEYLTSKKDGRYFQEFDYIDLLETPLLLTGDCLAVDTSKKQPEGEFEFKVYDKVGDDYVLNPNKELWLNTVIDPEENIRILIEMNYSERLPKEEFELLKSTREKEKAFKNRKGNKKK